MYKNMARLNPLIGSSESSLLKIVLTAIQVLRNNKMKKEKTMHRFDSTQMTTHYHIYVVKHVFDYIKRSERFLVV